MLLDVKFEDNVQDLISRLRIKTYFLQLMSKRFQNAEKALVESVMVNANRTGEADFPRLNI